MSTFAVLAIAAGLTLALAAFGGAISQAKATAAALEGMARQPEIAGKLQTAMIIGLALIESLVIYALLIAFFLQAKIPGAEQLLEAAKGAAEHAG